MTTQAAIENIKKIQEYLFNLPPVIEHSKLEELLYTRRRLTYYNSFLGEFVSELKGDKKRAHFLRKQNFSKLKKQFRESMSATDAELEAQVRNKELEEKEAQAEQDYEGAVNLREDVKECLNALATDIKHLEDLRKRINYLERA